MKAKLHSSHKLEGPTEHALFHMLSCLLPHAFQTKNHFIFCVLKLLLLGLSPYSSTSPSTRDPLTGDPLHRTRPYSEHIYTSIVCLVWQWLPPENLLTGDSRVDLQRCFLHAKQTVCLFPLSDCAFYQLHEAEELLRNRILKGETQIHVATLLIKESKLAGGRQRVALSSCHKDGERRFTGIWMKHLGVPSFPPCIFKHVSSKHIFKL